MTAMGEPLPVAPLAVASSEENRTSSWRTLRPELLRERCTRCNVCWKYCPDDAISFDGEGYPVLELAYCKGCGICAEECRPAALRMVPEEV